MKRVFVRAMSRSGGTLMCTILDAHPDIAMGYELYEKMLEPLSDLSPKTGLIGRLTQRPSKAVKVFAGRALRGGVDYRTFDRLAWRHLRRSAGFDSFAGRMLFIEKLVELKRLQENKAHWGSKVLNYKRQLEVFPPEECYFLFMQRDGRDVLASQKHTGNLKQSVESTAQAWSKQITDFQSFASRPKVNAHVVRYESLAEDPERVCKEICEFLWVPWTARMLKSHELDLTIHRNPMGHLSKDQITQSINTKSIGRYKTDLSPDEISTFNKIAKGALEELNY